MGKEHILISVFSWGSHVLSRTVYRINDTNKTCRALVLCEFPDEKIRMLRRNLGFTGPELSIYQLQGKIFKLQSVVFFVTCVLPTYALTL